MPLPYDSYDIDDVRSLEGDLSACQSPWELLRSQDARFRLFLIAFTSAAITIAVMWAVDAALNGQITGALLLAGVTAFVGIAFAMAVDELLCLALSEWECHQCEDETERWRAWP